MFFFANSHDGSISKLPNWASQLAALTRVAWTGRNGKCYFPYMPLTTAEYWEKSVYQQWSQGEMVSYVMVSSEGTILSHAAAVKKEGYYELGRWVAYPNSPRNATTEVSRKVMGYISSTTGGPILVETTQAHTASQFICERIGLRFAGIGFLKVIDGISWDIIYYDNLDLGDFFPEAGIIGNPLGKPIVCDSEHVIRLRKIPEILSSERGGDIPPSKFHVLPHRKETVRSIVECNIDLLVKT